MAFELFGIENENDFYPTAFLSSALEAEVADAIARWASEESAQSPDARLEPIAGDYLRLLSRIRQAGTREAALESAKAALSLIVPALGYDYRRGFAELSSGKSAPILSRVSDGDGHDRLWIIEAPVPGKEDEAIDPLSLTFSCEQATEASADEIDTHSSIEDLISTGIFNLDAPPRFVIVASPSQLVLVDRNKWASRAVLRFDLQEIFSRTDRPTFQAMACFLAREARVPRTGIPLAERLEEEAQRHANAVTSSLKKTVREAIEILGNEVLAACENKYPKGHPRAGVWIQSEDLSIECLRYMYRLLFLFYAEANPRLGIMPMKDPAYLSGYSLEALRGLESVRLRTVEDREGTYIWDSLQRLLGLMFEGLEPRQIGASKSFTLPRVRVSLLDPASTPILSRVRLRNEALQKIIRLLSLKRDKAGTGRISYAQLGIGQLGAVYETLISFTGFVAKSDLIELIPGKGSSDSDDEDVDVSADEDDQTEEQEDDAYSAQDKIDPLAPSYFVERSRADEFTVEQIVYDGTEPRIYKKGSFVYRLAGRDRQKSASYYTPEPLARLLVKHALMERCKDLKADEILELKVLEPAMGSAAFLVETTNQLADLYLERKQEETKQRIAQEDYFEERQRVRAYIADRNCFGVDLNPIAVELGQISLWLNSLHKGDFSPWFGDQLHAGNSLIGARRASYPARLLKTKKAKDLWLNEKPEEIGWRGTRPETHVWQFLLPAKDMAKFDTEKSVKAFAGPAQDAIKAWRKGGFFAPFADHEVKLLEQLSEAADALFEAVADDLKEMRESSNDEITIWPNRTMAGVTGLDYKSKLERLRVLQGEEHVSNSLPYQRLKTAMDAWCALWLWPLDQTDKLPSRREFLLGLTSILKGGITSSGELTIPGAEDAEPAQANWIERQEAADALASELPSSGQQSALFQATDIDALIDASPWLKVAQDVAARERFTHYDLIFADILRERGGFDVIVGNPPWAKPSWNEGDVLADLDPSHLGLSASQAKNILADALAKLGKEKQFLSEFVSTRGAMAVTSSEQMNPFAGGGSNNLYRCFIDLSFRVVAPEGYAALIHQDGHLGDPKSGKFRRHWYARAAKHFEFINRMKSRNFMEVDHNVRFSLNIYRGQERNIDFEQFTYAFTAAQIEDSYADRDGIGPIPSIKNSAGNWDTRGHRERVIRIDHNALSVIHSLSEDQVVAIEEARFIQPYSNRTLDVFRQMAKFPKLDASIPKITDRSRETTGDNAVDLPLWQMSAHWHETGAQKEGIIRRETAFYPLNQMIIQGPLFHVGNPLYKSPKANSRTNADYDVIDLTNTPDDYLPRTNYGPVLEIAGYRKLVTRCRWDPTKYHADFYRVAFRNMIALNGERSLIAAIIPRDLTHIHKVESLACADSSHTLTIHSLSCSIPFDYLIKANGRGDLFASDIARWPYPDLGDTAKHRSLRLACLTIEYADLWNQHAPTLAPLPWSSNDCRLLADGLVEGPAQCDRTAALRTEFARRMALVEIDVLVAQAFGLTLDQLIEIYRIYFPVLQENEAGTWYDQNGRIVWTCSKGLPGIGWLDEKGKSPGRKAWEKLLEEISLHPADEQILTCTATDDTQPGGPREVTRTFQGPFTKCDRVEDYKRAWTFFEAHKKEEEAA
ncbi:MAG: N-6 DNA methylase [Pseudomonadota bacterium]